MEFHLKTIGVAFIILALIHVIFPKYFNWKEEFSRVSLINKQMMYIHTFFISLVVLLMGLLCLLYCDDLINTVFGQKIALGLGVFWSVRFFVQFFGYSSELWKGKTFETIIHIVFALFWAYISTIFFIISFKIEI